MTRPASKRHDHIQQEKPKPAGGAPRTDPRTGISPAQVPSVPADEQTAPPDKMPASMARKYWIAILLWAIGFGLMVLFELISAIWQG